MALDEKIAALIAVFFAVLLGFLVGFWVHQSLDEEVLHGCTEWTATYSPPFDEDGVFGAYTIWTAACNCENCEPEGKPWENPE